MGGRGEYLVPFVCVCFFYFDFVGEKLIYFACGWGEGFIFCWLEFDVGFYFRD